MNVISSLTHHQHLRKRMVLNECTNIYTYNNHAEYQNQSWPTGDTQQTCSDSGARLANDISTELEIRPKDAVLWFKMYSIDHNEILHTSLLCNCRDVCKISLWSLQYILN